MRLINKSHVIDKIGWFIAHLLAKAPQTKREKNKKYKFWKYPFQENTLHFIHIIYHINKKEFKLMSILRDFGGK